MAKKVIIALLTGLISLLVLFGALVLILRSQNIFGPVITVLLGACIGILMLFFIYLTASRLVDAKHKGHLDADEDELDESRIAKMFKGASAVKQHTMHSLAAERAAAEEEAHRQELQRIEEQARANQNKAEQEAKAAAEAALAQKHREAEAARELAELEAKVQRIENARGEALARAQQAVNEDECKLAQGEAEALARAAEEAKKQLAEKEVEYSRQLKLDELRTQEKQEEDALLKTQVIENVRREAEAAATARRNAERAVEEKADKPAPTRGPTPYPFVTERSSGVGSRDVRPIAKPEEPAGEKVAEAPVAAPRPSQPSIWEQMKIRQSASRKPAAPTQRTASHIYTAGGGVGDNKTPRAGARTPAENQAPPAPTGATARFDVAAVRSPQGSAPGRAPVARPAAAAIAAQQTATPSAAPAAPAATTGSVAQQTSVARSMNAGRPLGSNAIASQHTGAFRLPTQEEIAQAQRQKAATSKNPPPTGRQPTAPDTRQRSASLWAPARGQATAQPGAVPPRPAATAPTPAPKPGAQQRPSFAAGSVPQTTAAGQLRTQAATPLHPAQQPTYTRINNGIGPGSAPATNRPQFATQAPAGTPPKGGAQNAQRTQQKATPAPAPKATPAADDTAKQAARETVSTTPAGAANTTVAAPVGTQKTTGQQGTTEKRPRGRPPKPKTEEELNKPKRPRGRPPKPKTEEELNKPKRPRGRPRKNPEQQADSPDGS